MADLAKMDVWELATWLAKAALQRGGDDSSYVADFIVEGFTAAGWRLVPPGGVDGETVERCMAAIEEARTLPIHTASVERVNGVRLGHDRSQAALRSLKGEG